MNAVASLLTRNDLSVPVLESWYAQNAHRETVAREALATLDLLDEDALWRALWLVRRAAADTPLQPKDLNRLADQIDTTTHWAWVLIMCQLWSDVPCPMELRSAVFPFLKRCLSDRRVIVRAWALTAMMRFRDDERYRGEIRAAVTAARGDPGKAMQARLRRLDREGSSSNRAPSARGRLRE